MAARMTRSSERIIAGVCGGLAEHLGVPVRAVRWIMVASSFLFGAGIVFYGWLWVLVPNAGEAEAAGLAPAAGQARPRLFRPAPGPARTGKPVGAQEIVIGAVLLVVAAALIAQQWGANLQLGLLIPLAVILAGAVLAWTQLDENRRSSLMDRAHARRPAGYLRLAAGLALVVAGVLVIVSGTGSWELMWPSVLASLAVLLGVGLVLAPWGLKFWRDLETERAGRVREAERAEIAAHLHDSVLQTLALIQKQASSEQDVTRLARAQERELRGWLYSDRARDPGNLVARIEAAAAGLEDDYGRQIDVVAVGDAPLDTATEALVQAAGEAMLNAVRHAGTAVSVYIEAGSERSDVFIKDRGAGFDPAAVPPDRLGVRESIIGRMQRHGGTARILSSPGGTEVRLSLPAARTEGTT